MSTRYWHPVFTAWPWVVVLRGITVRVVEPTGDGGVLLGVDAPVEAIPTAYQLLTRHYRFPVTCNVWS